MRILCHPWQTICCTVLFLAALVALVPIKNEDSENLLHPNFEDQDDTKNKELRNKRQIDDSDDEFKPRPSDFVKQEASLESQAFYFPAISMHLPNPKPECSKPDVQEHLKRIKKPVDDNIQIPLYDEDVERNPDPLRGMLNPKYWDEGNGPISKFMDFLGKSSANDIKRKDNTVNNLKNKDINAEPGVKGNIDENTHDEPRSGSGSSKAADDVVDPKCDARDLSLTVTVDKNQFQSKPNDAGKTNLNEKPEESANDEEEETKLNDANNATNNVYNVNNDEKDNERSPIFTVTENTLKDAIHKIVNEAIVGALENKDDDEKVITSKDVSKSTMDEYGKQGERIDDNNDFGPAANIGRRLLYFSDNDERYSYQPGAKQKRRYDRANYFAVDSNLDNGNEEQKNKESNLNFIRSAMHGISRASDNAAERRLPADNILGDAFGNFNLSGAQNYKRNVENPLSKLYLGQTSNNVKENRLSSENLVDGSFDDFIIGAPNSLRNEVNPGLRSNFRQSSNDFVEDRQPSENIMDGLSIIFNNSRMENIKRNVGNPPVSVNHRKSRRRQANFNPTSDTAQPGADVINSKAVKGTTSDVKTTTNQEGTVSSTVALTASACTVTTPNCTTASAQSATCSNETTTARTTVLGEIPTAPPINEEDEQLNINVSNRVVDAIFAQAQAHGSMRNSLGICRKSADLKTLKGSKVFESKSDSVVEDIMKCVNNLLKSHAEKQMCLTLDDSLHEFLKWMLLTGEASHGKGFVQQKVENDRSEFLFPSMCTDKTEKPKLPEKKKLSLF